MSYERLFCAGALSEDADTGYSLYVRGKFGLKEFKRLMKMLSLHEEIMNEPEGEESTTIVSLDELRQALNE